MAADEHPTRQVEVPSDLLDKQFWRSAGRYQFIYSMTGLLLGLASMILGSFLFLRGVTGATSWTAKILGASSQITDAAPGVVLFVVGLFVVYITRFKVESKREPSGISVGIGPALRSESRSRS
jgi:hypothetical protein